MSGLVGMARGYIFSIALGLLLTTCGDDKPWECQKPADCVGKPAGNYCKIIAGKGRCVIECLPSGGNQSNCPPTYTCTGMADDGSLYCKP